MKAVTKERRNTAPKEMLHRGAAQAATKTKQQIMEGSTEDSSDEDGVVGE